jgi:hypothetical protein
MYVYIYIYIYICIEELTGIYKDAEGKGIHLHRYVSY